MTYVFDPVVGWYDDQDEEQTPYEGDDTFGYQTYGNPFMPNLPGGVDKYGKPVPYGIDTLSKQNNVNQDIIQQLFDPRVAYMNQVTTGQPVFDPNQFLGGGMGAGGGAGGGGGGMGQSVWTTDVLDGALSGTDPLMRDYAQRIQAGENPFSLQLELLDPNSGFTNQDEINVYTEAINAMAQEYQGGRRNALQAMNVQAQPTAMQEWLAKNGMPNPLATYMPDALPGDVPIPESSAVNRALEDQRRAEALMRTLKADQGMARYEAPTMPNTTNVANLAPDARARIAAFDLKHGTHLGEAQGGAVSGSGTGSFPTGETMSDEDYNRYLAGADPLGSGKLGATNPAAVGNPTAPTGSKLDATFDLGKILRSQRNQQNYDRLSGKTEGGPLDQWIVMDGKKVRTNAAGVRAQTAKYAPRQVAAAKVKATNADASMRQLIANELARAGRTPARDAVQAQLQYLRQQGMGI